MKVGFALFLLIPILSFGNLNAQNNVSRTVESLSLDSQFTVMVQSSNSYQQYKVIELEKIRKLQQNVIDSLNSLYQQLSRNQEEIVSQEDKIESLENELSSLNSELSATIEEKDSVKFMGMPIEKTAFKTIMWSIVAFLILALLFFIYKYYNSQKITIESKRELIEAHKEMEEQRRRHIKKEQKIMRQLQDEINKNNR